jgi:pyruvate dehydrogenase complex dehydrogenase (E1) component
MAIPLDNIIKIAEKNILDKIPAVIEKRTDEMVNKILTNLTKQSREKYTDTLNKFQQNIDNTFATQIQPEFAKMYSELSKKILEDVLQKKTNAVLGGGDRRRTTRAKKSKRSRKKPSKTHKYWQY